jgi:hypothetical protein
MIAIMKKMIGFLFAFFLAVTAVLAANPPLTVYLQTEKSVYRPGEEINITLTVSNESRRTFRTTFPTSQQFDLTLLDFEGDVAWQWSKYMMFAQAVSSLTLKPGASQVYSISWKQLGNDGYQVETGSYTLVGTFLYKPQTNCASVELQLVE